MILIGSSLKSGIGQHAIKYTKLFTPRAAYYQVGETLPEEKDGLIFILPIVQHMKYVEYARTRVKNLACMTVCETETVHEDYQMIMDEFKTVLVPSEFCKRVFSKQFPNNTFKVLHAHIPTPQPRPYTFYFIGNAMDQRKNFRNILQAFVRLNEPNTRLLVKATCNKDIDIQLPRVEVINELLSDTEMDELHWKCDCYVSFSSSEGVGMGAIEAAIRDKPVIITNYGGAPEYIKTPYTIECDIQELSEDDFLFKKGMKWGKPNFDQLLEFMKHAYENNVRTCNHDFTRELVCRKNILREFTLNVTGDEHHESGKDST